MLPGAAASVVIILASFCGFANCRLYSRDESFIGYSESFLDLPQPNLAVIKDEFFVFSTEFGNITVRLFPRHAPKAVRYMKSVSKSPKDPRIVVTRAEIEENAPFNLLRRHAEGIKESVWQSLVDEKLLDGCSFYRAEPPGETIDEIHPSIVRSGYALIQGGLHACGRQQTVALPVESALSNKKGTLSLIVGTSEFFINLEDHLEWNGSFTVWGQVIGKVSWLTVEKIISLPTHQEQHPSGTILRILEKGVLFSVSHKVEDA